MNKQIGVLLVDDHTLLRKGLAALLGAEADIEVVGEASDGEDAVAQVRALQPDVVIMDISMPGLSGIDATRQIRADSPHSKVIALSIHSGKRFVDDMLDAGAAGYLLKESAPEEMVQGIRAVMRGDMYLSSAITTTVVSAYLDGMAAEGAPAGPGTAAGILRTKLHRPPPPQDLVPRTQLLARLDAGRVRPLTLVSAPAGYGKSVLISNWLENTDWPSAWYSLDDDDRNLSQFMNYLLAAVQCMFPSACSEILAITHTPQPTPLSALATYLNNSLDEIDRPFILVLDDYHRIDATSPVNELLSLLLSHPPIPLHLVIIARRDPPLPFVKLRAQDQLTEIRMEDLKFSTEETRLLLHKVTEFSVSRQAAANLEHEVEGWAVGLQLVAVVLRLSDDPNDFLRQLSGGIPQTQDYLIQEVLNHLPPHIKQWLLKTAILERFCAPLCSTVCANEADSSVFTGSEFIQELISTNLFIISLDENREWFRYHHLFQSLLRNELVRSTPSEEINQLHTRASQWFEAHNLFGEAIEHALQAADETAAAAIIERHSYAELDRDRWYVIERWLAKLPPEIIFQNAKLLVYRAWVAFFRQQITELPAIINQLKTLLEDQAESALLSGELAFFDGYLQYWSGNGDHGQQALEDALERIPHTHRLIAGEVQLHLGLARCMNGRETEAIQALQARLRVPEKTSSLFASRLLGALGIIHLLSGNLREAEFEAQRLLALAKEGRSALSDSWSYYIQACADLHSQQLEGALHHFKAGSAQPHAMDARAMADIFAGLALTQQLLHQPDAAAHTLRRLQDFSRATNDPVLISVAQSCKARLSLLMGKLTPAIQWMHTAKEPLEPFALFIWLEAPSITRARVLIAAGSERSLREATGLLREVRSYSEACRFKNQLIEVAVLQALALNKQGHDREALDTLTEALDLAAPGGWLRPFVEAGHPMQNMLKRLADENTATDYLRVVLGAFNATAQQPSNAVSDEPLSVSASDTGITEALTKREVDILELLTNRLQNKEIAAKLFVSPETVKSHLKHLYQKLGVSNRRDAASKAAEILARRFQSSLATKSTRPE